MKNTVNGMISGESGVGTSHIAPLVISDEDMAKEISKNMSVKSMDEPVRVIVVGAGEDTQKVCQALRDSKMVILDVESHDYPLTICPITFKSKSILVMDGGVPHYFDDDEFLKMLESESVDFVEEPKKTMPFYHHRRRY